MNRVTKLVVTNPSRIDLATKYFVNDLPGAILPATRISNILEDLEHGRMHSERTLIYLQHQGLIALYLLIRGEITNGTFCKTAAEEQTKREQVAEAERQKEEEERKAREAIRKAKYEHDRQRTEEERRKRETDPKYIAKMKNKLLRERFGLDWFIEKCYFTPLMNILHRLDAGNRLFDKDILWLTTEGKDYYTEILQEAFHKREAEFYMTKYEQTGDPWNAVNASSHYRKCNLSNKAHDLLTSIPAEGQKTPKLKSAICTTHGGAMRDLNQFDEALEFGNRAHSLTPKNFRPCTLLGAINIEIGDYTTGLGWYEKAKELGASERSIDYDLRGILLRANRTKCKKIRAFLLREDPERYEWARNFKI